ncbi:MAG: energy transducer TonB, partial [Syntrophales bacterium LBB04]|nr:energy transducer TonB [Syntrophales bacterium LBB04]
MNFDLARPQNEPAGITEQPARRSSVERINHAERKARPVPDRVLETIAKPEEEKKIVKETQQYVPPAILHVSPAAVEVMRGGDADKIDRSPAGDNVQKGGAAIGGPTSDYATGSLTGRASRGQGEGHDGSGRTRFLATHYSYIRDRILRNIGYPDVARRMKWEGKVLISFIITAEGNVEEIKVVQSSGFKVLDGNAVEAIVTA